MATAEAPAATSANPLAVKSEEKTPLDAYLAKPDPAYKWELVSTYPGDGFTTYVLELTSQTWRSAADVDRIQRAGHRIEADGEHQAVDWVVLLRRFDRAGRHGRDRRLVKIDQCDVVPVVRLEVADIDAGPLGCDRMIARPAAAPPVRRSIVSSNPASQRT